MEPGRCARRGIAGGAARWCGVHVCAAAGAVMNWLLLIAALIWAALTAFFRFYRIWLPYYALATAGCAYGITIIARDVIGLDLLLGQLTAWAVHQVSAPVGVPTTIFTGAPGALLVMVVAQNIGWTLLKIGVESSGLLEMAVLVSLLLFYPGRSALWRLITIVIGLLATLGANVLRMLLIITMLHHGGKATLVLAHSFLGRALFFGLTVIIYWYLLTSPTVRRSVAQA
jgi:exosortase family protein XrtG